MLDQLKMSAEQFVLGLKHGVYVFVSDACDYCKAYADSLKYIDNCNLHIVECVTDADKTAIYQLTGKGALPITSSWYDNQQQWAALGQLFMQEEGDDPADDDTWTLNKLSKYLNDTFGTKPLSNEEIVKKLDTIRKHCVPAYYVFPPEAKYEVRHKAMTEAFKHNEMPIDIDTLSSLDISYEDKLIMVRSNLAYFKLVIFDLQHTDKYSKLATDIIADYMQANHMTATFEMRDL